MKVDAATRARVLNRAGHRCEACGSAAQTLGWSVHHRRPRGMGSTRRASSNEPQNLMLLCGSGVTGCHGWVERHRKDAFALGYLVRQHHEPCDIPLIYRGGWARLTAAGAVQECDPPETLQ